MRSFSHARHVAQFVFLALLFAALTITLVRDDAARASPSLQGSSVEPSIPNSGPVLLTDPVPDPGQGTVRWFAATGHTLRGPFLDYWQRNGGLAQFGYPITEEFTEPIGLNNGTIMVQYFERNRFEHHPENAGTPYEVLLGTLGREFHPQDAPAQALPAPTAFFPETGHNLSGMFRAYWDIHGGLAVHGYPITE